LQFTIMADLFVRYTFKKQQSPQLLIYFIIYVNMQALEMHSFHQSQ
jgi:hypothetical protein